MNISQEREHRDILQVFAEEKAAAHGFLRVSAPMVRYSKLEFRKLVRKHGVKLCFTPMIVADSFNNSQKARENEFTTSTDDMPLIAQFAASNTAEFLTATQLIYPYVDGVDLNCGCPQSWAISKGYGCSLLRQPELMHDMIRSVRRILPTSHWSVSLKLRLLGADSTRSTVEMARQLEHCGATFLTLHGRTSWQRCSEAVNFQAIADVKQSLQIPLIANGNVRSWQDACELHAQTQADGIMAARGLLTNPTLFSPELKHNNGTSVQCLQDWLDIATSAGDNIYHQCLHHHLTFMWGNQMKRRLRTEFNCLLKKHEIFDFLEQKLQMTPSPDAKSNPLQYIKCNYEHFVPVKKQSSNNVSDDEAYRAHTNGKYFNEFNSALAGDAQQKNEIDYDLEHSFFTEMCA